MLIISVFLGTSCSVRESTVIKWNVYRCFDCVVNVFISKECSKHVFFVRDSSSKESYRGSLEQKYANGVVKHELSSNCPKHPSKVAGVSHPRIYTMSNKFVSWCLLILHQMMKRFLSREHRANAEEVTHRYHVKSDDKHQYHKLGRNLNPIPCYDVFLYEKFCDCKELSANI